MIKITELIKANIREINLLARCGGKTVALWEKKWVSASPEQPGWDDVSAPKLDSEWKDDRG